MEVNMELIKQLAVDLEKAFMVISDKKDNGYL